MNKFIKVKISDFGETITGKTPSSKCLEDFGKDVPFITPSDSFENKYIKNNERFLSKNGAQKLKNKIIPKFNVMVTCIGSAMGKVSMNLEDSVTNQQINSIKVNKKFNSDYVYYVLKNNYKLLKNAASGSTALPLLNKSEFDLLECLVHSELSEQEKIAQILSNLDNKIELNNKINQQLEEMAKTLYDYWFVQFDFPNEKGEPYKSSRGKMVFDERVGREVPVGWEVENLYKNSLCSIINTGIEKFQNDKIYLATADVNDLNIGKGNIINYENRESRANMQPTFNSVWFAKMKDSIKHLFISESGIDIVKNCILSTGFCGLKCSENTFEYMSCFINSEIFEKTKDMLSNGATMQAINNSDMKFIKLIIPNKKILEKFSNKTKEIFKMRDKLRIENNNLIELRDLLLPMLMSGQIKIEE